MNKKKWEHIASSLLKAELAKRSMNYIDLEKKLAEIGIREDVANIRNKFARGTFSAVFFLQCLRALGIKTIQLDDVLFEDE